jgi:hypothetical protein
MYSITPVGVVFPRHAGDVAAAVAFPAIQAASEGTVVVATGVSLCQRISHGDGRPARHPVELVRSALHP